jgi:LmbE family N-acetylglucosaminyl deacetylase
MTNILAVSAHPDDETLGAGGYLLKHIDIGDKIYWLNFTDLSIDYGYTTERIDERQNQITTVKQTYGFEAFFNLKLEPAGLDKYYSKDLIGRISAVIMEVKPSIVLLPFSNDVHSDHRIANEVVYSCTKIFRYPFIKKILMMEIPSETDFAASNIGFVPNYFVDISNYLDEKIRIAQLYRNEIQPHPFPRSEEHIRSLAVCRGAAAGCNYAEAYILLKEVE